MLTTVTLNPCLDVSGDIDQLIADRKLRCRNIRREPGGGGINVSRAAVRLGGQSRAVFPSGQGGGTLFETMLEQEGVDCEPVEHQGFFRLPHPRQRRGLADYRREPIPGPRPGSRSAKPHRCRRQLRRRPDPDPGPGRYAAAGVPLWNGRRHRRPGHPRFGTLPPRRYRRILSSACQET